HHRATAFSRRSELFRNYQFVRESRCPPQIPLIRDEPKKTTHAIEQDRPDVMRLHRAWFKGQLDLHHERLVFIDETWTATNMARSHGRCAKGERLRMGVPHGHRKTTTL